MKSATTLNLTQLPCTASFAKEDLAASRVQLVVPLAQDMLPVVEPAEDLVGQRMLDRTRFHIQLQIAFRHISLNRLPVDQYPVPRTVPSRLGPSIALVPLLAPLEDRTHIENHAPITEQTVRDQLAGSKARLAPALASLVKMLGHLNQPNGLMLLT